MADFQTSTHRARWIFTPQQLVQKYKASNQRAVQMLEKYGATRMEVDADGSLSYPQPQINTRDNAEKHSRQKPLNIEEEQFMRVYYEAKIREVCNAFYFPHKIQATALIYFKRFYLQWSIMEHDPKHIMLTCVYAACKIEENHVSAEELGKGISQDHQIILNNEMIVLQSLEFDLIVFAPYRSVEGFLDDMDVGLDLHKTAKVEVDKIMLTDAPLLFPPGQLALAALRTSNELHRVLDFERYLGSILSRQNSAKTISDLTESLNAIDSLVKNYKFPTEKDVKHIGRKLRSCWGLSSHDESKKRDKKSKHKSKDSAKETQNVHFEPYVFMFFFWVLTLLVSLTVLFIWVWLFVLFSTPGMIPPIWCNGTIGDSLKHKEDLCSLFFYSLIFTDKKDLIRENRFFF